MRTLVLLLIVGLSGCGYDDSKLVRRIEQLEKELERSRAPEIDRRIDAVEVDVTKLERQLKALPSDVTTTLLALFESGKVRFGSIVVQPQGGGARIELFIDDDGSPKISIKHTQTKASLDLFMNPDGSTVARHVDIRGAIRVGTGVTYDKQRNLGESFHRLFDANQKLQ